MFIFLFKLYSNMLFINMYLSEKKLAQLITKVKIYMKFMKVYQYCSFKQKYRKRDHIKDSFSNTLLVKQNLKLNIHITCSMSDINKYCFFYDIVDVEIIQDLLISPLLLNMQPSNDVIANSRKPDL